MLSYCCSSSGILQSHYTVLLSSSIFLLLICAFFMHLLMFKSFLSQFSPFVAQIKNFCSDPRFLFFLLTMFAKDLSGCFSHCCVEGGDHWIYGCIFVAHDGERCKPPAYHSLEGFQQVGIFQLFEVKFESYVFWLAFFFSSGKGGSLSSARHDHFKCLLLENFMYWLGIVHSWSEALPH